MPWNFMQVELIAADATARPMIGPGGLTRDQARAQVQTVLDRAAQASARFAAAAAIWKHGDVKDDTVYCGPFIWCIYQHPAGEDPRQAALEWAEKMAATMRSADVDVQIAKLPE